LLALIALVIAVVVTAAGCSSAHHDSAASGSGNSAAVAGTASPGATSDTGTTTGDSKNACGNGTQALATSKALGQYGIAVAVVYKYVLKPTKAGAFKKGAPGRVKALVKASAALLAAIKLIQLGNNNAAHSNKLCKLVPKLVSADTALQKGANDLKKGVPANLTGDVTAAQSSAEQLTATGAKQLPIPSMWQSPIAAA